MAQKKITVHPMFALPYDVPISDGDGGHGGGDPAVLNDLFGTHGPGQLNCAASHIDEAMSILTGIAANHAMRMGEVVRVRDLVPF